MKVIGADQPPSSSPESNQAIPMSTNDSRGAELVRGLLFHYQDRPWTPSNWDWHFWDQRWFGLVGD